MRSHPSFVALVVLAVLCAGHAAARNAPRPVALVTEGRPAAVIVLPDAAGARSAEQRAADLLATTLEAMSGARLEVKRERELGEVRLVGGRLVFAQVLGGDADLPGAERLGTEGVPGEDGPAPRNVRNFLLIGQGELANLLGVDAAGVGIGGIRLKTSGNAAVLLGGPASLPGEMGVDEGGAYYAAVELLERLGCRDLWPGPVGRAIPRRETVAAGPLDYAYTPQIRRRYIRGPIGLHHRDRANVGLEAMGISAEQWQEGFGRAMGDDPLRNWSLRRMGGQVIPAFPHAGGGLRNAERHLEENPEWFALQLHGTRDQSGDRQFRLCKSNPELIAHVANDIIERANQNPNMKQASLDPNDGGSQAGWCLCDNCKALDPPEGAPIKLFAIGEKLGDGPRRRQLWIDHVSLSDRMVFYWNSIAERVAAVHPDFRLGISVYSAWQHPPLRQTLHPNLVAYWVPSGTEHLQGWRQAGLRHLYYRPNILLANWRDGKLRSIVGPLAENMSAFADAGVIQTDFDANLSHWSTLGLSYYAAYRLNWNPYLTSEEIIADFAQHGFGRGAPHIEAYFARVEELTRAGVQRQFSAVEDRRYTPEAVAELRGLLNAAEEVADDPEIAERIAFLRLGLNFTELQETLDELALLARQREEVDMERARLLVDLFMLTLHDMVANHNLAVNVIYITTMSGRFAKWDSLRQRGQHRAMKPADPSLLERIGDPRFGLTGREQGIEAMLAAFGL